MDRGKVTLSIMTDYSKAFDTVDYETFTEKLHQVGFSKNAKLLLCSSYISNCTQFVQIDTNASTRLPVTNSVPQGSILGPKLFNIYVHDLNKNTRGVWLQYADEINMYASFKPAKMSRNVYLIKDSTMVSLAEHSRQLQALQVGDDVFVQNQTGSSPTKWDRTGTVMEVKPNEQYLLKILGTERVTLRNKRFLWKIKDYNAEMRPTVHLRRLEPTSTIKVCTEKNQPASDIQPSSDESLHFTSQTITGPSTTAPCKDAIPSRNDPTKDILDKVMPHALEGPSTVVMTNIPLQLLFHRLSPIVDRFVLVNNVCFTTQIQEAMRSKTRHEHSSLPV